MALEKAGEQFAPSRRLIEVCVRGAAVAFWTTWQSMKVAGIHGPTVLPHSDRI